MKKILVLIFLLITNLLAEFNVNPILVKLNTLENLLNGFPEKELIISYRNFLDNKYNGHVSEFLEKKPFINKPLKTNYSYVNFIYLNNKKLYPNNDDIILKNTFPNDFVKKDYGFLVKNRKKILYILKYTKSIFPLFKGIDDKKFLISFYFYFKHKYLINSKSIIEFNKKLSKLIKD